MSKNKNKRTKKTVEKDIKFSPVQNNSQHDATAASINEDHWKEIRKNWAEIGVELSEEIGRAHV